MERSRTDRTPRPRRRAGLGVALATCVLLGACASDDGTSTSAAPAGTGAPAPAAAEPLPEPVQHLDIRGSEYRFEISPDPAQGLRPGWTSITFHNVGGEAHQVMFARLKDGVDLAELGRIAGNDSSGSAAIAYVDMLGGVSYIGPDNTITAMVDLPAGTVMAMCYVPNHEGIAHALLGMSTVLTVTDPGADPGTTGTAVPAPPATTGATGAVPAGAGVRGTIELSGEGYRIPSPLPACWYRVTNTDAGTDGAGLHELSILRLGEPLSGDAVDALMQDLATNATPAVELDAVGGLGAISPGFEGYLYLDLPPGDYVAVDFMPDPGDPRPHLLDGYYATFRP